MDPHPDFVLENEFFIYRSHGDPGRFVLPALEFETFLLDLEGMDRIDADVVLVKDWLLFIFGDDPKCFNTGFETSEKTETLEHQKQSSSDYELPTIIPGKMSCKKLLRTWARLIFKIMVRD